MSARSVSDEVRADLAEIDAESRFVTGGPVRLHVLDYGGDRPPMLVLPGITSPAVTWDFVVSGLRDLVRPVVLDIRGRGLSDAGESYTMEDYAQDTEAVLRELGLEGALLLGHSMGARIAALTAARGNVALAGTILVDPPLSGPGRDPYPTSREAFLAQLHEAQRGTTAEDVGRFYPRWPERERELRARWLSSCDEKAVVATHRGFEEEDFFDWWPRVPAPTAFVFGAGSPVVTAAGAQEAAAANASATQHVVPDAGHMIPWDEPAAFEATVRGLLTNDFANPPVDTTRG
jgi:N-formylmaleamate deformylase